MTNRSDVAVDFELTPRLADITSASEEITVQDSHDTLSAIQDESEGGQYEFLVSTTGGEPLGGGVTVGLTTVLNNLQYAFQATSPASTGAITTTDADGTVLHDSSATFVTDNVKRGDWVINFTDQSVTEILTVDSETQLTTRGLRDGTANTFTTLDNYKVWEVSEAELSGGNFTGIDSVGADLNPLFPSFGRFITRTAAASATTQELADIQYASFNGGVSVDPINGTAGTVFPTGTERQPSNNFTDALTIAAERGFLTLYVLGNAVVNNSNDFSAYTLVGQGQNLTMLTLASNATFINSSFMEATVSGELDGDAHISNCIIDGLTFVSGVVEECILTSNPVVLGGALTAHLINCSSGVPGASTPTIDMGGSGQVLALRNYNGGVKITNKTGTDVVSIDLNSGHVILDSTVTAGVIVVRGVGKLTDNSTGSVTVIDELVSGLDLKDIHGQVTRSIFVNTENISAGTGYQQDPYNTWSAAIDDAEVSGLSSLRLLADATVDRQIKNFTIIGDGLPVIDLNGQNMDKTTIERCTVTGSYSGVVQVVESAILNLSGMAGAFLTISASGTLTASPGASLLITNVQPASPSAAWTLDMNSGQASTVGVHNISGEMIVTNMDDAADTLHLHFDQGEVNIAASCTTGTLVITGDAEVSGGTGGVTVIDNTSNKLLREAHTRLGLEAGNAWTDTPTQSGDASGDIIIDNTGDGVATSTGTRQ